ncbi:MAG: hypothetical protein IT449_16565 [Phycisphaerales bacterium]|nr:hypothetical protein [Phycisphaerales bacterium]
MLRKAKSTRWHRPGSSLLRTLVVAAATLTTLMVCFAIYQSTQQPRTETPPTTRAEAIALPRAPQAGGAPNGGGGTVEIAPNVRIGSGEGTVLSIYPRQGDQAIAEVEADNWFPTKEGGNELKLVRPLVRLRTKSGQRVNVRSDEGLIEINTLATQRGKRLEWQRGKLFGNVVVEIDRLSEKEREALPPHEREVLSPWRLVTARLDQIEFDIEYNHVKIDGPFHLTSRELELDAVGLDVRLDPSGGRVETLKILEGRSLTVRGAAQTFDLGGGPASEQTRFTSWLDVVRAGLTRATGAGLGGGTGAGSGDARANPPPPTAKATPTKPYVDEEGALVLVPTPKEETQTRPLVTYKARFERAVQVVQRRGEVELGRLEANVLEILRDFGSQDRQAASSAAGGGASTTAAPPLTDAPESDVLTVNWTGPLYVEWVPPADAEEKAPPAERLWISALGEPMRVADGTGQATAAELVFHRETGDIHLVGSKARPVVLDNEQQGRIEAVELTTRGDGQKRTIVFTGPGRLTENTTSPAPAAGASQAAADPQDAPTGSIRFAERMELDLELAASSRIDLRKLGTVSQEKMVPREARFFGRVLMDDGASRIGSDTMKVSFQPDADRLRVSGLEASGGVDAVLGENPASGIVCKRLEVDFDPSANRVTPVQARAFDAVAASHDTGRLTADERMVFDFQTHRQTVQGQLDVLAEYVAARRRGVEPESIDWSARREDARRRTHEVERVALRKLTALGNVVALDEPRRLDIKAQRLECTLNDAQEIESALVVGAADAWAHVMLDTLTVDGPSVSFALTSKDAGVSGAGRMSFLSAKDLDGKPVDPPIPIHISWTQSMAFVGRDNLATFLGTVHAASEAHTFDAERLDITFQDRAPDAAAETPKRDWWVLADAMKQLTGEARKPATLPGSQELNKEPVLLAATGRVAAVMSNEDPASGRILNRAQLKGPDLTVDLRVGSSAMNVTGEGTLLIEDYEVKERSSVVAPQQKGFLSIGDASDRSQTLIQWHRSMRYDFEKDQAEFDGTVHLQYLTGPYLVQQAELGLPPPKEGDEGRDTGLDCGKLTVDFATGEGASASASGGFDTRRIRQFRAVGDVRINDPQIVLAASDLIYHRASQQLLIRGTKQVNAELYVQKPGAAPFTWRHQEMSLNLETLEARVIEPRGAGSLP